jgi:hypothetical protein
MPCILKLLLNTHTHTVRAQLFTIVLCNESCPERSFLCIYSTMVTGCTLSLSHTQGAAENNSEVLTQGVFEHLENESLHDRHVCRADTQAVVHWRKLHIHVHTQTHTDTHMNIHTYMYIRIYMRGRKGTSAILWKINSGRLK